MLPSDCTLPYESRRSQNSSTRIIASAAFGTSASSVDAVQATNRLADNHELLLAFAVEPQRRDGVKRHLDPDLVDFEE
jgi:hypothetical protein